jgi:hypothetical protein
MSLVLKRISGGLKQFWDGTTWNPDKDKAKTYENRDDLLQVESAHLDELEYGKWQVFLFEDFCSDFYDGMAFAIARDENEAKELIIEQFSKHHSKEPYEWGKMSVWPVDTKMAAFVCGGG